MELVDHLNRYPFETSIGFFKKSNLLNSKPEVISLNMSLPNNDELNERIISTMFSRFDEEITKKVFTYIFKFGNRSFVDFRNKPFHSQITKSREITSQLNWKNQKYDMVGSRILYEHITESLHFHSASLSKSNLVGKLVDTDIWFNPHMSWNDGYILLFKEILIEISNLKAQIVDYHSFNSRLDICFDFKFEVIYPELFFIIEDKYQKNWLELLQEDRDKKIDYILDENKKSG